jgi:iron complex transport system substrate-binding protein
MPDKRIISLVPLATEIIFAFGLHEQLVGCSQACDIPDSLPDVPVFTSVDINAVVLANLHPDLIFVSEQQFAEVKEQLLSEVEIYTVKADSIADLPRIILEIGEILDRLNVAEELTERLNDRINIIKHKLKFIDNKQTVACITSVAPLKWENQATAQLIEIAGAKILVTENGEVVDFDQIRIQDPEVIIMMPSGYSIQQSLQNINTLLDLQGWNELSAVKNNKVFIADGAEYFGQLCLSSVDSIEILAEILHPKQFIFGYEDSGWIKFNV